jgi:translocator protein
MALKTLGVAMGEIASRDQLRMSFVRWALLLVPLIIFLGFVSGQIGNSGFGNAWFAALTLPSWFPPALAFPVVWTLLYAMMGVATAMIADARGAKRRSRALLVFTGHLLLNLAWAPLFFGAHQISAALVLIIAILVTAAVTAWLYSRIRPIAGLLFLPYLAWLIFATALNFSIDRLNPDAETLSPSSAAEFVLPAE